MAAKTLTADGRARIDSAMATFLKYLPGQSTRDRRVRDRRGRWGSVQRSRMRAGDGSGVCTESVPR